MVFLFGTYIFHYESLLYGVIIQLLLALWVWVERFSLYNLLRWSRIAVHFFVLLHKLFLSPELLVFSPVLPPSVLSMGHSWSKHRVLHIIRWQSPTAVSLWSRCKLGANFLIHLTEGCLTGSVLKLMSSIFNSMYNSWSKQFRVFFGTNTYATWDGAYIRRDSVCIANDLSLTIVVTLVSQCILFPAHH